MDSKLNAARMVTDAGEAMVVAHGRMENVLPRILDHEVLGTLFAPSPKKRPSRIRWIGSARPVGSITVSPSTIRLKASTTTAMSKTRSFSRYPTRSG